MTTDVNVTCIFTVEGDGADVRTTEVAPAPTACVSALDVLPPKFESVLV